MSIPIKDFRKRLPLIKKETIDDSVETIPKKLLDTTAKFVALPPKLIAERSENPILDALTYLWAQNVAAGLGSAYFLSPGYAVCAGLGFTGLYFLQLYGLSKDS